jgi:endonuclease/exonuclease/phosphatase family metal-dependent hydrolase
VDLIKDQIRARAIENTARIIREVGADIVGVVEAEDRITLQRFSQTLLLDGNKPLYPHVMVIDGNDSRGIDVGVLSNKQYPIQSIRSHVDEGPVRNRLFSRDKRKAQATRVGDIYNSLRAEGVEHIVVLGDLNDTPDSDPASTPACADRSDGLRRRHPI